MVNQSACSQGNTNFYDRCTNKLQYVEEKLFLTVQLFGPVDIKKFTPGGEFHQLDWAQLLLKKIPKAQKDRHVSFFILGSACKKLLVKC
jgi:hypothetical protein